MVRKGFISFVQLKDIAQGTKFYRKIFRILLWCLIPIVIWWTLKEFSIVEIVGNFQSIGLDAIVVLIGVNVIIFALLSLRWWLILRAQGNPLSLLSLINYRLAGFGITYFTPGPQFGGEPLQIYLLNQREGIKTSIAAASVTVDKLLELLANFSFLLVGITVILLGGSLKGVTRIGLIVLPTLLLMLPSAYLFVLKRGHHPISSILATIGGQFIQSPRFDRFAEALTETEKQVSKFCQENTLPLLVAAVLSVGIWVLMVFEFSLMMQYLGVHPNLLQVLVALTAARLAFLLPLPAGLGTLEAGQVMAMGLIGVNPIFGVSLSILIRIRDVIIGSIGLWLGGVYSR